MLLWTFRRAACRYVALVLVGAGTACGKEPTAAPLRAGLVICHQPMSVAVDSSQGPRFSWVPGCGATYLEVTSPDHQRVFWIVQGDTGKIAPGVVYGVAPPGYESVLGPFPLESEEWYTVRVGIMVEESSFYIFGEQDFRR